MGKAVGTILKVAGAVALTVATGGTGSGIFAGVFAEGATFLGMSATLTAIAGAAATLVGSLLTPPRDLASDVSDQGRILNLRTEATAPRRILYGMAATGGDLIFRDTTGTDNSQLQMVIALAGHKIEGLVSFRFGETLVSLNGSGNATSAPYVGKMTVKFHDGDDAQLADTGLVAASAQWTSAHRLRGVAYAYLNLTWDQDAYPQGFEAPLFTLKGRKIYDPRLDSSNGGAGLHRLNDEATWQFSDNAVLCIVDYLRGIYVGGALVAGMGVSNSRIDWPNVISEANIADEQVQIGVSSFESRYSANGWIDPTRPHRDNLAALGSSCGGNLVFQGGKWRCYVAASRTATLNRNADDVIGPIKLKAKKSAADKINSVRGVYADPAADYALKDFPPYVDNASIAADGGQEHWSDLNLPFTKSPCAAQRLAKIALGRGRMEKIVTTTFTLAALNDQAMDAISFTHDRFHLASQKMLIADWQLTTASGGLAIQMTMVEDTGSTYDFDYATEMTVVADPLRVPLATRRQPDLGALEGDLDQISDGTNFVRVIANERTGAARGFLGLDDLGDLSRDVPDVRVPSTAVVQHQANIDALATLNGPLQADAMANNFSTSSLPPSGGSYGDVHYDANLGRFSYRTSAVWQDMADITELNTANDVSFVNTKSAVSIKAASENTEFLLSSNPTQIHPSSVPLDLTTQGSFVMDGLIVSGTLTYINSNQLDIGDNLIRLNADEVGVPTQNAGIEIERGTSPNVSFFWDETGDRWSTGAENLYVASGAFIVNSGGSDLVTFNTPSKRVHFTDGTRSLRIGFWDGSTIRFEGSTWPLNFQSYGGKITLGISGTAGLEIDTSRNVSIPNGILNVNGSGSGVQALNLYGSTPRIWIDRSTSAGTAGFYLCTAGATNWQVGQGISGTNTDYEIYEYNGGAVRFKIIAGSGDVSIPNGGLSVAGPVDYSGKGGFLYHDGAGLSGKVTVSSASPSGGSSGDIWLKV
jgi:hypothetical protein